MVRHVVYEMYLNLKIQILYYFTSCQMVNIYSVSEVCNN